MSDLTTPVESFSLNRWSRLKRGQITEPVVVQAPPPLPTTPEPVALDVTQLKAGEEIVDYMQAKVPELIKRAALKTLFKDPHFNVMDGLDIYIDDYSVDVPIPAGWIEELEAYKTFINPPKMQVNAFGYAEEVRDPEPELVEKTPEELLAEQAPPQLTEAEAQDADDFAQAELDLATTDLQASLAEARLDPR
jgi:phenylalanyl-tRNA synthetase beta subunit